MKLLWSDKDIYTESCMFAIERSANLLFEAEEIIKIETPALKKVYREGVDYRFEPGSRVITLTANSEIPYVDRGVCYPEKDLRLFPEKNANAISGAINGKYLLFNNENFFSENQVEVTYRAVKNDFCSELPEQNDRLLRVRAKIAAGKNMKIVLHGDSISEGFNSTKFTNTFPYNPPYMEQVCFNLPGKHSFINRAVEGKGIHFPRTILEQWKDDAPDLMVIAFGMNDFSSVQPDEFIRELDWMIETNRKVSPETEYIIIVPMTGNPEWQYTVSGPDLEYARAMLDYAANAQADTAVADVQRVWKKILSRKKFLDLTGNGVNHPNDYGHRIYASVLLDLLLP